jgi:hypothetical protein
MAPTVDTNEVGYLRPPADGRKPLSQPEDGVGEHPLQITSANPGGSWQTMSRPISSGASSRPRAGFSENGPIYVSRDTPAARWPMASSFARHRIRRQIPLAGLPLVRSGSEIFDPAWLRTTGSGIRGTTGRRSAVT